MNEYSEDSKLIARQHAIKFAVKTLSENRFSATITRKTYVREVFEYLISRGSEFDKEYIKDLELSEIDRWEKFYNSLILKKKASDLKVAYLSGPNPINDLNEFISLGILPENVWAFESHSTTYDYAVIKALESEFPFVKIYKGKIENYFKILSTKFDIIYLDFCGTIASKQILSVIRELFYYQKLNSPGVLITNFSLPQRQQKSDEYWDNLITLSANYLYPKRFTEQLSNYGGGINDSAEASGLMPHQFLKIAFQNPLTFYSQFITRILFDFGSLIIPYQRFCSNPQLTEMFFKNFNLTKLPNDRREDIGTFPNDHTLLWGLENQYFHRKRFDNFISKFRKQLALNSDESKLLEALNLNGFFH